MFKSFLCLSQYFLLRLREEDEVELSEDKKASASIYVVFSKTVEAVE